MSDRAVGGPDHRQPVAVTGFGVFSCFGRGAEVLRANVFTGTAGFGEVTRFDTGGCRVHRAAHARQAPELTVVLEQVARDALQMSGRSASPERAAVLLGTQGDWAGLTSFWRGERADAASQAISGAHAALLSARLGITAGRRRVFNNGCIASSSAIAQGAQLIATGREELVLAGGGYLVDEEFFAKFDSGRALTGDEVIRPFSKNRAGLLLGDGVAMLTLEPLSSVRRRGGQPLAILAGAALSADSHHVCRPHPQGAGLARAITSAIAQAGLAPDQIDYVNAHGTGTPANDAAETLALRAAFGDRVPPTSSTKSCTGHTLEGSGALEAVISLIALSDGVLPPTAGYREADPDCAIDCIPNEARRQDVRTVLSSSSAFGGANAALVLAAA
ncbi:MAG: beta-ketoacyl-[acyl-carrier-protein] synthase family protein [Jatrophihabitans sp.]